MKIYSTTFNCNEPSLQQVNIPNYSSAKVGVKVVKDGEEVALTTTSAKLVDGSTTISADAVYNGYLTFPITTGAEDADKQYTLSVDSATTKANFTLTVNSDKNSVCEVDNDTMYTLPTASPTTLGGVKVGTNLTINSLGVMSATQNRGTVKSWLGQPQSHVFTLNTQAQAGDIIATNDLSNFVSAICLDGDNLQKTGGNISSFYTGVITEIDTVEQTVTIATANGNVQYSNPPTYGGVWHITADGYGPTTYNWYYVGPNPEDGYWWGTYGDFFFQDGVGWKLGIETFEGYSSGTAQDKLFTDMVLSSSELGETINASGEWSAS